MLNKVNFLSQDNVSSCNNYGYKINKGVIADTIGSTVKETKSNNLKVDWLDVDKIIEFARKTNSASENIKAAGDMKKFVPGTVEKTRQGRIEKEKEHIAKPVTERTAYNTKQLRASGVKERDVYRYLTYDGHVNNEGKKILREHGKSYK